MQIRYSTVERTVEPRISEVQNILIFKYCITRIECLVIGSSHLLADILLHSLPFKY